MAFEAGRGTGRTPRDSEGTRRTALPDPRGLPTDAGRNWRRTLQDLEGRPVLPGLLPGTRAQTRTVRVFALLY